MYSNDFARWVGEEVGDEELAAALSDISGAEPATIEDIRKEASRLCLALGLICGIVVSSRR
jgi:hypothetical protein